MCSKRSTLLRACLTTIVASFLAQWFLEITLLQFSNSAKTLLVRSFNSNRSSSSQVIKATLNFNFQGVTVNLPRSGDRVYVKLTVESCARLITLFGRPSVRKTHSEISCVDQFNYTSGRPCSGVLGFIVRLTPYQSALTTEGSLSLPEFTLVG